MAKLQRYVEELSQVFRVLGDPTRLRIWVTLQEGEHNVTQLCEKLEMPQPTVSHHLSILRMSGMVTNRRSGKEIHYSLKGLTGTPTARALKALSQGQKAVRIGPLVFALAE